MGVRGTEQGSYSVSSWSELTCLGRRISGLDAGNTEALMVGGDLSPGWDSRSERAALGFCPEPEGCDYRQGIFWLRNQTDRSR